MMKRLGAIILMLAVWLIGPTAALAWQSDLGDGMFRNPPLFADYPDPDIIRVDNTFYFATTTFANVPGLTLLASEDLVNWGIVGHVIARLEGREQYDLKNGSAYRSGVFAPSIRHFRGTFYIAVTPVGQNTRIYFSKSIEGPWSYHEFDRAAFDPGLFIDSDGKAYLATSGGWDGHEVLLTLSSDLSTVTSSRGIYFYKGVEGSKMVKRGDWYYIFNALPSRLALMCSRSRSIYGPYETIESLDDRAGGHQGAIVDLPDGGWYGFVMRDCGAIGRMTFMSPIFWKDDWPIWGTPETPGVVPPVARKPLAGKPVRVIAASDEFDSPTLGLQWQWNHNPDDSRWSLTDRPGFLRLKATTASSFWLARNTLIQKGQGPRSRGEVKFDLSHLKVGDICGFGTLGKVSGHIAVIRGLDGGLSLAMNVFEDGGPSENRITGHPLLETTLYLRTELDFVRGEGICSFSEDETHWAALGGPFRLEFDWRTGTFQGEQLAIFCYNPRGSAGFVDVDWFRFEGFPN